MRSLHGTMLYYGIWATLIVVGKLHHWSDEAFCMALLALMGGWFAGQLVESGRVK